MRGGQRGAEQLRHLRSGRRRDGRGSQGAPRQRQGDRRGVREEEAQPQGRRVRIAAGRGFDGGERGAEQRARVRGEAGRRVHQGPRAIQLLHPGVEPAARR